MSKTLSPWKDPKKETPQNRQLILVRRFYRGVSGKWRVHITEEMFFTEYGFRVMCDKSLSEKITHWMEIPPIPKK